MATNHSSFFWGGFDVDDFPNQSMYLLFSEAFNWCQDMDTQSIQPNAVTLTAVLRTLGRSGQATTARELAERMNGARAGWENGEVRYAARVGNTLWLWLT